MKYQIWDKKSSIITPIGEVLTPEEWIKRYPMTGLKDIKTVIGGGVVNGSVCMEFTGMVDMYRKMGCDFTGCVEDQDFLDAIEAFEDRVPEQTTEVSVTAEERIAAALEAQVMMSLPDGEEE